MFNSAIEWIEITIEIKYLVFANAKVKVVPCILIGSNEIEKQSKQSKQSNILKSIANILHKYLCTLFLTGQKNHTLLNDCLKLGCTKESMFYKFGSRTKYLNCQNSSVGNAYHVSEIVHGISKPNCC